MLAVRLQDGANSIAPKTRSLVGMKPGRDSGDSRFILAQRPTTAYSYLLLAGSAGYSVEGTERSIMTLLLAPNKGSSRGRLQVAAPPAGSTSVRSQWTARGTESRRLAR